MIITEYICELLYRYNCVVIPDFGAFLTQRIPASIATDNKLLYPPKKLLSFNSQIKNSDGLLANYIAKKEDISYDEANLKVQKFVQELLQELNVKNKVSLPEIGFFTLNFEQNLVFEPLHTVNYLTESFGLSTLKVEEAIRDLDKEKTLANNAPKVVSINNIPEEKGSHKNRQFLKYASVGILLLGISGIGVNSYKKRIDTYNTNQFVQAEQEVKQQLQSASFVFEVNDVLPSINIKVDSEETETTSSNKYHIIAGAFREYQNAERKLSQLKRKGFKSASYIGKNRYGLHQITYSSHNSENKAVNTLNKIKKTQNPTAWLYTEEK